VEIRDVAGAAGLLVFALLARPALAQSTSANPSGVPDRFRLEAGGFVIGADSKFTLSKGGVPGTDVDFETDLDLPDRATRASLELFWRAGRRHLLSVGWNRLNRTGDGTTLSRDITWGDTVITAGATAKGTVNSQYVSAAYRFAAYRNDRFEIGPAIGLGYLEIKAGIQGEISASGSGGSRSESFDLSKSRGQPTANLGAYLQAWPANRLLLRGDMRYIIVKPGNSEASITEGRASLVYHIWPKIGLGLQYTYTKFRYDQGLLSTNLSGSYRYSGGQLLLSGAF
jgi:hypothetical protein